MTRKDYELIAFVIGTEISMRGNIESLIKAFGEALVLENPNFNFNRFENRVSHWANPNAKLDA